MQKNILRSGALTAAAGVALGAFGAHALEGLVADGKIESARLETWHTAVQYQFYAAFALCILALAKDHLQARALRWAHICMITGIFLFSGSLYLLVLSPLIGGETYSWLGAITPLGGLLFIAGWLLIFFSAREK